MDSTLLIRNQCETFRFCISEANAIPDKKLAIKELVEKGGQVCMNHFDSRWRENPIIATIWSEEKLVSCGALKIPTSEYKRKIFMERAKSDYPYDHIQYELGWIVTDETYRGRGLCRNIVKTLLQCDEIKEEPLYATTRQDNYSMQNILKCNGFYESGDSFKSKCGDYDLILLVRNVITTNR